MAHPFPKGRTRAKDRAPDLHAMDVHVGSRIRLRRTLLGLSQETLGDRIGLTFQQVQKYERGANRVSAGMLWRLGQVLDCPISFFFDDAPQPMPGPIIDDPLLRRETLELARNYYRIGESPRRGIYDLVKRLAVEQKP
jgi:transcriptional regulator with XRE-family HTH domain